VLAHATDYPRYLDRPPTLVHTSTSRNTPSDLIGGEEGAPGTLPKQDLSQPVQPRPPPGNGKVQVHLIFQVHQIGHRHYLLAVPDQNRAEAEVRCRLSSPTDLFPSGCICVMLTMNALPSRTSELMCDKLAWWATAQATSMIIVRPPPPSRSVLSFVVWCGMWQWMSHLPGSRASQTTS
jgi:hypothetical protein